MAWSLRNEGVRHAFSVPGESYIALLDGLKDVPEITLITNRHEGSACLMAEAYGKTTRTPGVCMVTRGPGATNASIGVHLARYDSTPLILLIGQVARSHRGKEAGQEIDYTHFFGSIAKWVIEINDPREVPRIMARAFHVARSGRPGPVVVSLPRDMLEEEADIAMVEPYPAVRPSPDPELVRDMVERVNRAEKPVLLAGSVRPVRARPPPARGLRREVPDAGVERVQAPGRVPQHASSLRGQSRQPQQSRQADRARRSRPPADRRLPLQPAGLRQLHAAPSRTVDDSDRRGRRQHRAELPSGPWR